MIGFMITEDRNRCEASDLAASLLANPMSPLFAVAVQFSNSANPRLWTFCPHIAINSSGGIHGRARSFKPAVAHDMGSNDDVEFGLGPR